MQHAPFHLRPSRPSWPDASRTGCTCCDSIRPPEPGWEDPPTRRRGKSVAFMTGGTCGLHEDVVKARTALHERLQRLHKVVLHAAAQAAVGQLHPLLQRQRAACLRRARVTAPRSRPAQPCEPGRISRPVRHTASPLPDSQACAYSLTSAPLPSPAARPQRAGAGLSSRTPASLVERRSASAAGHGTECADARTQRRRAGGTGGPLLLQNRRAATGGVASLRT